MVQSFSTLQMLSFKFSKYKFICVYLISKIFISSFRSFSVQYLVLLRILLRCIQKRLLYVHIVIYCSSRDTGNLALGTAVPSMVKAHVQDYMNRASSTRSILPKKDRPVSQRSKPVRCLSKGRATSAIFPVPHMPTSDPKACLSQWLGIPVSARLPLCKSDANRAYFAPVPLTSPEFRGMKGSGFSDKEKACTSQATPYF